MAEGSIATADFFLSRAGRDAPFAVWLGKLIAAQGKTYVLQDEHFGHQNFMGAMDAALKSGARVVGLLSQAYTESDNCLAEALGALAGDSLNKQQRLVLMRLEPCAPGGLLANIAFTDLLAERRQSDARALALKVLRALGFENPRLQDLPSPPAGTLSASIQLIHAEVQVVPGFTGREAELDAIEQALWTKGGTAALTNIEAAATAAVKGLGGVGKSVLAKEYAWRNRARYHGVWWVRAETRETLLGDLIQLGSQFIDGLQDVPEREQAARKALDHIEQAGFEKPWLIVYDNVEEPGHIDSLTPRNGAHALITTRWSDWGKIAAPVKVGVFPSDVAAQYLLDATGRSDAAGAAKLAEALGRLPLALDHAAAYCRRTGIDFATYEKLAADLIRKAPKGVAYDTPVFATFSLAIDKAAEACPEAQKLMGICAFLAPDRIPLDIFTKKMLSEIERGEAVAALHEVSLVTLETLDDGSPGVSVHRLVQQVMHGRLVEKMEHENAAALTTGLVADAFPHESNDVRTWPACSRLLPHAIAVIGHAPDAGEAAQKTSLLLNQTALNYASRAAFSEAEPLYRRALAIDQASFGPDHPSVAVALNNLAVLLEEGFGRYEEAEKLKRRALAIDETSFGPDDPRVAIDLNNLAQLLRATNRRGEAEPLMRRALAIGEASLGPDHPNVATHLNNLAGLLRATDRLGEAEPLYRRALAIGEASLGPDHPSVAIRLNNLAGLLRATDRLAEAEPLYLRALAIDEAGLGPDHPDVAIDLNNLAGLLRATNRLGEAEPLYRRALAIGETSFGPDHPSVATGLNSLAALLHDTNRLAEAEPLYRRALAIAEASYGADHPTPRLYAKNLALLLGEISAQKRPAAEREIPPLPAPKPDRKWRWPWQRA